MAERRRVEAAGPVAPRLSGREALLEASLDLFARSGIGDTSLRRVAADIGTSHRMLLYHFGSREGLLVAVVEELERRNGELLAQIESAEGESLHDRAWRFWQHAADTARAYGPLFFELTSQAMLGRAHADALAERTTSMWLDTLTALWTSAGLAPEAARVRARLNLAVSRGLIHDLLLTGDRGEIDAAMADFATLALGDGFTPHVPTPGSGRP